MDTVGNLILYTTDLAGDDRAAFVHCLGYS